MNRTELAERLKRSREALGWVFPGQFQELVENLDATIAYLEDDTLERRYRLIENLILMGPYVSIRSHGSHIWIQRGDELGEPHITLDSLLDAWTKEQSR